MNSRLVVIVLLVCAVTTLATSGPLPVDKSFKSYDSDAEEAANDSSDVAWTDVGHGDEKDAEAQAGPKSRLLDYSTNTHLQKIAAARAASDTVNSDADRNYLALDEQHEDEVEFSDSESVPSKRCVNFNDLPKKYMHSDLQEAIQRSERDGAFDSEFLKRTIQDNNPRKTKEDNPLSEGNQKEALYNFPSKDSNIHFSDENPLNSNNQETNQQTKTKQEATDLNENRKINVDMNFEMSHFTLNRDRREAQETQTTSEVYFSGDNVTSDLSKADNEDEETAIKRHIKRLSDEELKELLNSLSNDKKELLKKIIGSDSTHENVNKREIIKKSGAVESNANLQSEINNVQSASAESSVTLSDLNIPWDATKSNIQSEMKATPSTQFLEFSSTPSSTEITSDLSQVEERFRNEPKAIEISSNTKLTDPNAPKANKRESKRDIDATSLNETPDSANIYSNFDESNVYNNNYFCSHEDAHQSLNADPETTHESELMKRDIQYGRFPEMSSLMKSLEESFPCINSDDSMSSLAESEMMPLVRVKRKDINSHLKKRSNTVLDETRIPYLPYRAENDDEDNDEGNEFDDDGFYDRTSNFAKSRSNSRVEVVHIAEAIEPSTDLPKTMAKNAEFAGSDCHGRSDTNIRSLGSDTDNVLSSMEGVDENLSFSSDLRNRRSPEDDNAVVFAENIKGTETRMARSTPLFEDKVQQVSDNIIVPNYQENDAFGGLPINYEGDLGRYKRIRRVKQPAIDETLT
ncbi:hypothetical protein EVAR_18463_1 [Eumeta japonica]|uniref:Uncharacterized protein n=1 Tax=Eumeta variegata TaxID=151549 RepID=A0A4C1V1H5_EUMVA|nr:hypothetical protein EVAR_18463_1 [Eumeta japonica]